jgi:hypothetical protein
VLVIHGGSDACDGPILFEDLDGSFTGGYGRVMLDGIGHFPPHANAIAQADLVHDHLRAHQWPLPTHPPQPVRPRASVPSGAPGVPRGTRGQLLLLAAIVEQPGVGFSAGRRTRCVRSKRTGLAE